MTNGRGTRQRADLTTVTAALVMVLTWGSSSVGTKAGLESYSPGHWTLLRFIVTTVALIGYVVIRRIPLPARRDVLPLIGLGLVGISITQLGFSFGLRLVDPGTATFMMSTVPVMTAVLGRFVLKERLTTAGWAGIGLTVIGTTVLVLGQGQGISYTRGALFLLIGAMAEAWYYILQKPFLLRYTAVQVSTWTIIASTLPLLMFAPGVWTAFGDATLEANLSLLYVGLGAGVAGYVAMTVVNSRVPAFVAAVLMAAMSPVALITGWLWLGTVPPLIAILGGAVAIVGVVLVTLRGQERGPR